MICMLLTPVLDLEVQLLVVSGLANGELVLWT